MHTLILQFGYYGGGTAKYVAIEKGEKYGRKNTNEKIGELGNGDAVEATSIVLLVKGE